MLSEGDSMLLNMLTGLLEDAVKALQRIERKVEDQTIIFKKILDKIDGLEKDFESEISALTQKSIPEIHKVLIDEIESLGLQDLNELEISLDHILNKLQKSIQILTIQGIIKWIENLSMQQMRPTVIQQAGAQVRQQAPSSTPAPVAQAPPKPLQAPVPSASPQSAPPPQEATEAEESEEKEPHLIKPSSFFSS